MKARLVIKNFGPIKYVDLDLRNLNVFIGPQASGKSALAKIYTICKSPLLFFEKSILDESSKNPSHFLSFKKNLEDYNILSFLNNDTFIEFDSELHYFKFDQEKIYYNGKFLKKINQLVQHSKANLKEIQNEIINILSELYNKLLYFEFFVRDLFNLKSLMNPDELKIYLSENNLTPENLQQLIDKLISIESELSSNTALYIPAERNFITIIKGASLNLLNNNVPIPKHILSFGAEFEKASYEKKELDLSFLKDGLSYKNVNGIDYIFHSSNKGIKLTESASGLQSIVPLLLPILSKREISSIGHRSFVIEEPELNLFPKAQYELIKVLESDRFEAFSELQDIGTIHTYTTHSPYILSAFNNLLYADAVQRKILHKLHFENKVNWDEAYRISEDKIKLILPSHLDPEYFSAYQIFEGGASPIFDRESGLIQENFIDDSSDQMGDDFDSLMEIMNKEI